MPASRPERTVSGARIPHKAGIPGQDGAARPTAADTAAAACGMFHMECIRPSHPGTRRFKNGIFPPSGLSHPLPYNSMAAFFGFPDKKPSRFRSKIFGKPRESACAALDRGLPAHGGRRGYKAIPARPCRKNDGFSIALSVLRVSPEPMSTGSCGGSGPSDCSFCRMNAWDKNTNAILRHF